MDAIVSPLSRVLIGCVVLVAGLSAQAQQYRWVDANGRVQYTDTPPPAGARNVQKKNLNAGAADSESEPYALQIAIKKAPVKLYSSPDCGAACDEARTLLNNRGIPFSEFSITSAAQLADLKNISGGTVVPVTLVGGDVLKGFEAGRYQLALDAAGYPKNGSLRPRHQAAPPPPKPPAQAPRSPATPGQEVLPNASKR